jgi:hypothetical protein
VTSGSHGPGQRRAQLLAQARHACPALQKYLHGHTADGLAYLVVEHVGLGQQDRPQGQRMDLRRAVAQDVVGPPLHGDAQMAMRCGARLLGERVVQLVPDQRLQVVEQIGDQHLG